MDDDTMIRRLKKIAPIVKQTNPYYVSKFVKKADIFIMGAFRFVPIVGLEGRWAIPGGRIMSTDELEVLAGQLGLTTMITTNTLMDRMA